MGEDGALRGILFDTQMAFAFIEKIKADPLAFTAESILFPFKLVIWVGFSPFLIFNWVMSPPKVDPDACRSIHAIPREDSGKHKATYPAQLEPADALGIQELIDANAHLVHKLCFSASLSEDECDKYLLPTINQLAMMVHLVPASQYDHHHGYGGLFTHTLEVARFCANRARNVIFDLSVTPEQLYHNKRRWILTAILAALAHDIGKPYTDMDIVSVDGKKTWGKNETLVEWLRKEKIKQYRVAYRQGRQYHEHQEKSLEIAHKLIDESVWDFIGAHGQGEQMQRLFRAALLHGKEGGLIGEILEFADMLSKKEDLEKTATLDPRFKNIAHPQGDMVLKAIRNLINNNVWTTNEEKSQIFNTKMGCFIVWSAENIQAIFEEASSMGAVGIPIDSRRLASILIDAKVAEPCPDEVTNTGQIFWLVTPIVLNDKQLSCIRIANDRLIYDAVSPVPIEALVAGYAANEDTKQAWIERWKSIPKTMISHDEEQEMGYTPEFFEQLQTQEAERQEIENEVRSGEWQAGMMHGKISVVEEANDDQNVSAEMDASNLQEEKSAPDNPSVQESANPAPQNEAPKAENESTKITAAPEPVSQEEILARTLPKDAAAQIVKKQEEKVEPKATPKADKPKTKKQKMDDGINMSALFGKSEKHKKAKPPSSSGDLNQAAQNEAQPQASKASEPSVQPTQQIPEPIEKKEAVDDKTQSQDSPKRVEDGASASAPIESPSGVRETDAGSKREPVAVPVPSTAQEQREVAKQVETQTQAQVEAKPNIGTNKTAIVEQIDKLCEQMQQESGSWVNAGIETDRITGCLSTSDKHFVRDMTDWGVDLDVLDITFRGYVKQAQAREQTHVQWDRERQLVLLRMLAGDDDDLSAYDNVSEGNF